jgi:Zn-dependent protease with chaperone function
VLFGFVAAAAVLLPVLLLAPHLLPRATLSPGAGIALFLSVLALQAAVVSSVAVIAVLALPSTPTFGDLSGWCLHTALPYISTHLGLNGHAVGHAAVLAPASLVLAMLASACLGTWRATREVRGWIRSSSIGSGPGGSLIVGGSQVVLATTGIRHPQVVVSAGALITLDEGELSAGLEHERGHVRRGHRFISLAAVALHGCSRLLPGSRSAVAHLQFHLERDADEYALRRTNDPASLASAIFKAAAPQSAAAAMNGLGGSDVADRIRALQVGASGPTASKVPTGILTGLLITAAVSVLLVVPLIVATTTLDAAAPFGNLFAC